MRDPFPHQVLAVDLLRAALKAGKKRPILSLGCGAGKTKIASDIFHMARAKGKRCLFVADQITLIDQTIEAFYEEGHREIGALQGNHPMTDYSRPVQVASIQTLARRALPEFDLAIFDECFPAGTMVSTPEGNKCIDSIRKGDIVHNAIGVGMVLGTSVKMVDEIARVTLLSGETFKTTPSHPFFTRSGWVQARALAGQSLGGREELRGVWGLDEASLVQTQKGLVSSIGSGLEENEFLRVILRSEILESNGVRGYTKEAICDNEEDWSQANAKGREWKALNGIATGDDGPSRPKLDSGICGAYRCVSTSGNAISNLLQDRSCQPISDDSDGIRRIVSCGREAVAGCEEGRFSSWKRVESVEIEKLTSPIAVFNLHISKHPSYFAEGFLVHNCHIMFQTHRDIIEDNPNKPIIGLSATPWTRGLGNTFDCLIVPATAQELIDAGRQLPLVAYAPHSPDLSNVKIKAGEYDEGALSIVMQDNKLVADAVQTWKELGEGRPTLGYAVDRAHGQMMCDRFNKAGIPSGYIDGDTPKTDRDMMKSLVEGGTIKVVWSIGTMIKGVDWLVSCGIDCQPTKSHMRHVQKCGRVVRTTTGEDHGLWLDHAGNCLRLGMPVDIIRTELCTKQKGEKSDGEALNTKPTSLCPKCKAVKTAKVCVCGYESKKESDLTEGAGQLARIDGGKTGPVKGEPTPAEKAAFYAELKGFAALKGKKPTYPDAIFKRKYGHWPAVKHGVEPRNPTPETLSYIRAANIRFARGMEAARKKAGG